jgi:hypothetical protein
MADNNFRDRAYRNNYNDTPERTYPEPYRNPDYRNEGFNDRPDTTTLSERSYEPRVEERRLNNSNYSNYDNRVNPSLDRPTERSAVRDNLTTAGDLDRRDQPDDMYVSRRELQRQSDIQEVHRSNNIAIGLLLGVLLTSIIGILGAIFYFATTEPEPATVQPAPTETQPQTTTPGQ